ncbi:MAG: leucine-rich repeat protein [Christensenellales bacterium]
MKKFLIWLLAAALLATGCAVQIHIASASGSGDNEERVSGNFTYTLNDSGEAIITGYNGDDSELTVPKKVDNYPVVEIGADAFFGCDSLIRVSLPEGLQSIGDWAFYSCDSLTSITLPEGVHSIGDHAFYSCASLTSITLPEGLHSIGGGAFSRCTSLTSITLPNSLKAMGQNPFVRTKAEWSLSQDHPHFALVDGMLIDKGEKRLVSYSYGKLAENCVVPEGVHSIGDYAFFSCASLTSITLPEGLHSIGGYAFSYCDSLTSITLPNSLKAMGTNPFLGTKAELSLSPNHPHFALLDGMLFHKGERRLVYYPFDSLAGICEVPEGTLHIGSRAFYDTMALRTVVLPEGLQSIGDWAFSECDNLTNITLPEGLHSIGDHAFFSCASLTSITLPEGLHSIGSEAFFSCASLTSITLPKGLHSIGSWAFYDCDSLTSITLPEGLQGIGDWAFSDCNNLTILNIPASVITIGREAFNECPALTLTVVPDSPGAAYANENNIPFVYAELIVTQTPDPTPVPDMPAPETEAPDLTATPEPMPAFDSIMLLKEYQCDGFDYKLNMQGEAMIIGCQDAAGEVTIPAVLNGHPVTSIGDWTFYNNNRIISVTLPEGLRHIGTWALGRCSQLAGIALPDSLETMGENPFALTKAKLFLSPDHPHFALLDGMLFHKGERRLVYYPFDSLAGTCEVPEGTLHIGSRAFCNTMALRTVVLPEGLQSIEGDAFTWCFGLRRINIPASVMSIAPTAFTDCQALTLTVTPDSIGAAFANDNQIPFVYAE